MSVEERNVGGVEGFFQKNDTNLLNSLSSVKRKNDGYQRKTAEGSNKKSPPVREGSERNRTLQTGQRLLNLGL